MKATASTLPIPAPAPHTRRRSPVRRTQLPVPEEMLDPPGEEIDQRTLMSDAIDDMSELRDAREDAGAALAIEAVRTVANARDLDTLALGIDQCRRAARALRGVP